MKAILALPTLARTGRRSFCTFIPRLDKSGVGASVWKEMFLRGSTMELCYIQAMVWPDYGTKGACDMVIIITIYLPMPDAPLPATLEVMIRRAVWRDVSIGWVGY